MDPLDRRLPEPLEAPGRDQPVAPWKINPSAWSQRIPIVVLAALGFLISTYLALYQWRLVEGIWDPFFASEKVLDSDLSHGMRSYMGMPDAGLGAIAYLGDVVFGLAGSTRRWQYRPWMVIVFGIDVIPLGIVSAILVVCQGAIVGHWCTPCLATAVISLVLVAMAYDEVWACLRYLQRVWRSTRSLRVLWRTFSGQATPEAAAQAFPDGEIRPAAARAEAVGAPGGS